MQKKHNRSMIIIPEYRKMLYQLLNRDGTFEKGNCD